MNETLRPSPQAASDEEAAKAFLAELVPTDPMVRRRSMQAILRGLVADGSGS